jgi:hypothetical protein
MTATHEPGEVWHIGWDWHADMWYVEPPYDVELDEPMKWFHDRYKAFDFVDEWLRSMPVQATLAEDVERLARNPETVAAIQRGEQHIQDAVVVRHEDNPYLPKYVPQIERQPEIQEPVRVLNDKAADRVADYASRVGLK